MSTLLTIKLLVLLSTCPHQITVNSGLRTPSHNKQVGGAPNSLHLSGKAVDISTKGLPTAVKECLVQEGRKLFNGVGVYKSHIHLDIREPKVFWRDK